jgi:hypothetical protein
MGFDILVRQFRERMLTKDLSGAHYPGLGGMFWLYVRFKEFFLVRELYVDPEE